MMPEPKSSERCFQAQASLALAERAAREAGRVLTRARHRDTVIVSETMRDVKLSADRAAEDAIADIVSAGSPAPILAEERVFEGGDAPTSGLRWIVDPLDGTMNYLQRIPFCCVSVSLWENDLPLVAAVYDFDRDEMFTGLVGTGTWVNGAVAQVGSAVPERAILCTGFPVGTDFSPAAVTRFVGHVGRFRKIRMLGSAALSLAYVAAGRADAYFERDVRIWDVAGGLALVCAAGGAYERAPSPTSLALTVYAHNGACPWPDHDGPLA
ncbi:MAG: inositol monophosphatase family protein [Vicinamibacterales bacterium]|jgi:myo-inositol-1(or 4)-monophosphatase|nr:inositol monophosphatase family protein [Vicinamibacterales bacterium]